MGNMAAYFATMKAKQAAMIHAEQVAVDAGLIVPEEPLPAAEFPYSCPKCGKPLKAKGRHFHIQACNEPGY